MAQRHMPIGYKLVDGKIQLNDPKANIVRHIYQEYASGASLLDIAKAMTAAGFPNANNQPKWYHGTVSNILDNVKYQGDEFYPPLIDKELFEKVQRRRDERCEKLGRNLQLNSASRQSVFSGILRCGECGDVYRKYVEHCGKPSKQTFWKCKRYIHKNKVCCCNSFLTDEQIRTAFLIIANRIITNQKWLDRIPKKEPAVNNFEYIKLDKKIKELEAEGQYSSKELPALIFERAKTLYRTSRIDDAAYNTVKIKQAFSGRLSLHGFDEKLFQTVIRQVTVHKDERLTFEFINGLTLESKY